ncbi:MAG: 2OG-Fe(II) oxygenase [Sutterellaceae bacterium]|nr:2OG-Fe(II) oxygenase [Burkholderiaceae bacterium]MDW8429849.1 2OG-Fe(II) oxygenase [Sutterellaceae bacterium]
MKFESLAADLQAWLKDSIGRGCTFEMMEQSLRAAGYQPGFARQAVELAFTRLAPQAAARAADGTAPAQQEEGQPDAHSILAESPNTIETSDRPVHILMALNAPRIVLFGNLLAAEECDALIEMARPRLQRSTVVNAETGAYDVHEARTSRGTYFERGENDLIRRIENRIAEVIERPVEHGEPIQVLHYLPGAEYKPHYDYFDPKLPGNERVLAMGGQRVATIVMYLNDVVAGGSTVFPQVGLDVLPRKGNAVFFAYSSERGELDARTLHGGSPVAEGEKWIATKWIRVGPYRPL